MKILALIKYSLDVAEIKVDAATKELRMAGVPEKVGNMDKNVVEAAVQLKEKDGGSLVGLSLGPAAARDGFREVLAMGVDEVNLVEDPFGGKADSSVAVSILEAAIKKLGPFDLIVAGFASDDGYTHQVGPRLAERFGLPLVSFARQVSAQDGKFQADRDLDDHQERVEVSLPAVVTIAEEAYPPRRTTLMDALKAKKKPVNVLSVGDLGLDQAELEQKSQVILAEQQGIVVHRKQQIVKGASMQEMADKLIDILVQENVLKGGA
jgi:electron transfer flavoprotein beta subunit